MIQKYKKRPVVIDAIQFFPTESCLEELADWGLEVNLDRSNKNLPILRVPTLEGTMIATEGDYIIKGIRGEFYPCRADIFFDTYERADSLSYARQQGRLPKDSDKVIEIFRQYGFKDEIGHDLCLCIDFLYLVDAYCNNKAE